MPALGSDRVYVVDVKTDPRKPRLDKVSAIISYLWKNISTWSLNTTPLYQVIEPWELHALGVGTPHTTHCLADGNVMISTLRWRYPQPLLENIHHRTKSHSDGPAKNGQGNFVLLDGKTFKPKATWPATEKDIAPFGYDFWYDLVYSYLVWHLVSASELPM